MLSDSELSASETTVADKKAPGSERAAERAAAAQQNSERAHLGPQSTYVDMQVSMPPRMDFHSVKCRVGVVPELCCFLAAALDGVSSLIDCWFAVTVLV